MAPALLPGAFSPFQTPLPASAAAWDAAKPGIRRTLARLLGDLPPPVTPEIHVSSRQARPGYTLEHFRFDNGAGADVYGYLLLPEGPPQRRPAILYHHFHGDRYGQGKEELFRPGFAEGGLNIALGEELARAGYLVLAIDAYLFGQRQHQGPAGDREEGGTAEASLFKTFLWQGRTLWGMMLRDDRLALDYLCRRPEVDPTRIAAMGMSMGATRTWWLAALDQRIAVAVSIACLTRYQDLVAAGEVAQHGIYYYVPGMLHEKLDAESVVGLIAPRPHLTQTGDRDAGSPAAGVRTINAFQEQLYALYHAADRYRGLLYPGLGHVYTPEMWQETRAWLRRYL